MNYAAADAVETARQLQKLSRELQPVKTALAALIKREKANPSPEAAAVSLDKIANRVADVSRKYDAYFNRISLLLDTEIPRLQEATPIIECTRAEDKTLHENGARHGENGATNGATSTTGTGGGLEGSSEVDEVFRDVCSSNIPYLLRPENYHAVRERMCMQIEMVDYLISTDRYQLARHVAESYGLPLFWFPKLLPVAFPPLPPIQSQAGGGEDRGREFSLPPSALTSPFLPAATPERAPLTPEHIAMHCLEERHSVTEAIAYCEERLLPALEPLRSARGAKLTDVLRDFLVDLHATRLLQMFRGGQTDQPGVIHYIAAHLLPRASRRPFFVQSVINTVTQSGEGARKAPALGAKEESSRLVASMMSAEGYHRLAILFHRVAVQAGAQMHFALDAAERGAGPMLEGDDLRALPDLVTRVLATAIFLKDEYFERMLLERHGGGGVMAIPGDHLHTQSGSAAFDEAMMAVVEEMLRRQVLPTTGGNTAMATHTTAGAAAPSASNATNITDGDEGSKHVTPLAAAELLAAEERWSSDVLFIKRPTRFYCYHTRECIDGGSGGNFPFALPNGTVVSKLAMTQSCVKRVGEGDMGRPIVVCPRTKEEFAVTEVKRIFVT